MILCFVAVWVNAGKIAVWVVIVIHCAVMPIVFPQEMNREQQQNIPKLKSILKWAQNALISSQILTILPVTGCRLWDYKRYTLYYYAVSYIIICVCCSLINFNLKSRLTKVKLILCHSDLFCGEHGNAHLVCRRNLHRSSTNSFVACSRHWSTRVFSLRFRFILRHRKKQRWIFEICSIIRSPRHKIGNFDEGIFNFMIALNGKRQSSIECCCCYSFRNRWN